MDYARNKAVVIREVVEREELDDDKDTLASTLLRPSLRGTGGIDPDQTVEEVVFGKGVLLSSEQPDFVDWRQRALLENGISSIQGKGKCFNPQVTTRPVGNNTCPCVDGVPPSPRLTHPPPPTQYAPTSEQQQLKQRIKDMEKKIAKVNLCLQKQGIETEMSEESQLRFMSFLIGRLWDLEDKMGSGGQDSSKTSPGLTSAAMGGDGSCTGDPGVSKDSLGNLMGLPPIGRVCSSNCGNDDGFRELLFDLVDIMTKRSS